MFITRKKEEPEGSLYLRFFLIIFFIIHIIKKMHTITSPNTTINIDPPTPTAAITNNDSITTILNKIRNITIIITPFLIIGGDYYAKKKSQ